MKNDLLGISSNPEISVVRLYDGSPCMVVDNFFRDPVLLRTYASLRLPDYVWNTDNWYPGPEYPLPQELLGGFVSWWKRVGPPVYGVMRGGMACAARLSLTCTPPEQLGIWQRVCHQDPPLRNISPPNIGIAGVAYLFDNPKIGGTAFYRPVPGVDFKEVAARFSSGDKKLEEDYEFFRKPSSYLVDTCEFFERMDVVDARFNRVIFFPSNVHHTGHIVNPDLIVPDAKVGRLSVNFFIQALVANSVGNQD